MQASVKYVIIRLSYQVFFQNATYETLKLIQALGKLIHRNR